MFDFLEIITIFEGIIGQTSISRNQSSRGGIDNLATEVDTGNAISSMSIQPVSDTNVSSSASMLLDSVDESQLGSTTSSSVSTLSNVLPHSGASGVALSNTVFGSNLSRTSTTLPFTSSVTQPKRWTQLPQLPKKHGFLYCIGTVKGKVEVSVFHNLYVCDIQSSDKGWMSLATVPELGARIQTIFTANDCLFATYYPQPNSSTDWSLKINAYDIDNNVWGDFCSLELGSRLECFSTVSDGDKIYIIGCEYQSGTMGNVLIYDMRSGQQTGSAKLKQARKLCSSVIIDNMLCVVGGLTGQYINSVEAMSISDLHLLSLPATSLYGCSCAVASGKLVVGGGRMMPQCNAVIGNSVCKLDSLSGVWQQLPSMSNPRFLNGMCTFADKIILAAGGMRDGTLSDLNTVEALNMEQ